MTDHLIPQALLCCPLRLVMLLFDCAALWLAIATWTTSAALCAAGGSDGEICQLRGHACGWTGHPPTWLSRSSAPPENVQQHTVADSQRVLKRRVSHPTVIKDA